MTTATSDNLLCENIHELARALNARNNSRPQIMEICGTHTMAIARNGLKSLWGDSVKMISGPGCPVCVTDGGYVDQAIQLARGECLPAAPIIATYGDMVRVPGREGSLAEARACGAEVEVVFSADQAIELAAANPSREVVFLAVGFETTTPGTALAVRRARDENVKNFSALTAHKLILPAMNALLSGGDVRVDGFLCPSHVSVILGYGAYEPIVADYGRPCVVAGFEPKQILTGVETILRQLADGEPSACSIYPPVRREGNRAAQALLEDVFTPVDAAWRALGVIPGSGLVLRDEFADFDAARRFDLPEAVGGDLPGCRCGEVLCGLCAPVECGLFGGRCTPRDPVGPCMVSSEGACAAAYKYERHSR